MSPEFPGKPAPPPRLGGQPSVWVVVPTKNGVNHLAYSLPSLLESEYSNMRVVVVDDRSSDGTGEFVKSSFPQVDFILSHRRPGFAGTVNAGIEHAYLHGADIVAVSNNDIRVHPDWLKIGVPLLKGDAVIGFDELPMDDSARVGHWRVIRSSEPRPVSGIAGCLYLCPVSVFESVGMFDENYFMYGEDNDFFFRLRRSGFSLLDSGFPVWHVGEGSSQAGKPFVTWLAYRNAIQFAVKNESLIGNARVVLSLLNQGCNPFLLKDKNSPNRERLRRFPLPVNFLVWAAALCWNLIHLPATLLRRLLPAERLRRGADASSVLILTPYFLPGFKSGGPVRSLTSLVQQLRGRFIFNVITADREREDPQPFAGVQTGRWCEVAGTAVYYLPPGVEAARQITRLLCQEKSAVLYLNSVFSPVFTALPLMLRLLGVIPTRSVVVSPRGELSKQALAHKRVKKGAFICLARLIGAYSKVLWQAASAEEAADIRRVFGSSATVEIAMDLTQPDLLQCRTPSGPKLSGRLKIVFLARIARIKNLLFAIQCLTKVRGNVEFDIFGPIEDMKYWNECRSAMKELPGNVRAGYQGVVSPQDVVRTLSAYDLFFLPSESESFGHGIFEALNSGCPILIGTRTPWRNLHEKGCGWDLPLEESDAFTAAVEACVLMEEREHALLRNAARRAAEEYASDSSHREKTIKIFETAHLIGSVPIQT